MTITNELASTHDEGLASTARVVKDPAQDHLIVLVANAKGGCGKTTLSTNLASCYASRGHGVSLLDMDPQQSSSQWLRQREKKAHGEIHGLSLSINRDFHAGRLQSVIRQSREYLVIDSPAGLEGPALDALLRTAHVVLVPVLPSPIDIRAATRFLQAVMLSPAYRRSPRRIAVVANRARERTRTYTQLQSFLNSLKIPFLATLRDTQLYVQATGLGIGVSEIDHPSAKADKDDWQRMIEWLEVQRRLMRTMHRFR
ncbi:MAG: ParA family protein [Alcanivoracaceae bacterium]|nr:ParA family protein [Alcanivoracaceae bacterium]